MALAAGANLDGTIPRSFFTSLVDLQVLLLNDNPVCLCCSCLLQHVQALASYKENSIAMKGLLVDVNSPAHACLALPFFLHANINAACKSAGGLVSKLPVMTGVVSVTAFPLVLSVLLFVAALTSKRYCCMSQAKCSEPEQHADQTWIPPSANLSFMQKLPNCLSHMGTLPVYKHMFGPQAKSSSRVNQKPKNLTPAAFVGAHAGDGERDCMKGSCLNPWHCTAAQ